MELIVLSGRAIFVKDIEADSNECQLRCHPKPSDSPYSIKLFLLRESKHILVIVTFYNWKILVSDLMTPLVTSSIFMVLDILYLCFHLLSLMFFHFHHFYPDHASIISLPHYWSMLMVVISSS